MFKSPRLDLCGAVLHLSSPALSSGVVLAGWR